MVRIGGYQILGKSKFLLWEERMTIAHYLSLTGKTIGIGIVAGGLLTASIGVAGEVAPMDVKFMEDNS